MVFAPHLNASLPGTVRLGPVRLPVYGLFATAGLLAALALSQKAARRVGLKPEPVWDAGIFVIGAAFVLSRLLLVAENWTAFRAVPMLVLTVPSLTYGGSLLTALATWVYLRRRGLPVLRVMDAWAPCAALLAGFLQLGHFFEGTDAGMPTGLPWGIVAPGDTVLGKTHPVQIYAVLIAVGMCVVLYRGLRARRWDGEVAAVLLGLGGLLAFGLDMLRQPMGDSVGNTLLPMDASQMIELGCMLLAAAVWWFRGGSGEKQIARGNGRSEMRDEEVRNAF
jgi:phosphatidylglycerol:prolipoprotein diacylglycerol transferase